MSLQLPKDALQKVQLGQSFAEYDLVRSDASIFVPTPASIAATDRQSGKRIFVGRRGCGKTAIAFNLARAYRRSVQVEPMVFDLLQLPLEEEDFRNTRQRPFKSLVCAFERTLLGETVKAWCRDKIWKFETSCPDALRRERGLIEDCDFDTRVLNLHAEIQEAHKSPNPKLWLRQIKRSEELCLEMNEIRQNANFDYTIIVDRLDESWDGSESAVICLMALMHACIRLSASSNCVRPYVFVRENIYQRIRKIDNEFSRLETSVVFLEWTQEKLVEMVERRLMRNLPSKPKLGEVWGHFFDENDAKSKSQMANLCQCRPRDILTYVSFAQEVAVGNGHARITSSDTHVARERFSTSKLKDLADEFDENYHNLQLVLQLFYGLATTYTVEAVEQFIQRLLTDRRVSEYCKSWLFEYSTPHQFIELLYQIGFWGIGDGQTWSFKSGSGEAPGKIQISASSQVRIHIAYHSALHLTESTLREISDDVALKASGILEELPENVSFETYQSKLKSLLEQLELTPKGKLGAIAYEDIVGEVIKLCFFRSLTNVVDRVRDSSGSQVRDWIASNRAKDGFWEMIRTKYRSTQVIWECKNYDALSADDFHQITYYIQGAVKFGIIAFRGQELKGGYIEHVKNAVRGKDGMILIVTERDVKTFLRQAMNGKAKEDHISEIHDRMERQLG